MKLFRAPVPQIDEETETLQQRGATREALPTEKQTSGRAWSLTFPVGLAKPLWTIVALLVFLAGLWAAYQPFWAWLNRPVAEISVTGKVRHLDKQALADNLAATLEQGLLETDIATLQEQVVSHPWVRNAGIVRDWPHTLEVNVEEEVPVARWWKDGLLNQEGEIFWPELKPEYAELPRLSGASADTVRVMGQFHDLNQMLRRLDHRVVALNLEPRGAWSMKLDNGIEVIVGRSAVNERLERFIHLYSQVLAPRAAEIEQIDIRYANGVSVKWKPKDEEDSAG